MAGFEVGSIMRAQDFGTIKHNEDIRPAVEQAVISSELQKTEQAKSENVNEMQESDWYNKRHDASDKGDNEYTGDGGANRKRKDKKSRPMDRVIVKGRDQSSINITI